MLRYIIAVVAIIMFFIGALMLFGWFGTTANIPKGLGFDSLGLIAVTVAVVVPDRVSVNAS